ncbi:DUF3025 domain-containing protein [Pelomonas sp. CA6]|uniref:DUF3025 domain-containing protein n=1 Tax=Pelomonas sp. CA6 TaxID=2907999 RepID=UPI001F4B0F46|nr:DUF3025 domain-containing protein [Pelomonas sp. CA6]MCH7341835.1 DUF3025 domain-containing protein [Pelomonas sp. CA6]
MDFHALDWSRPWWAPYRACGEPVLAARRAGMPLHEALNRALARQPEAPRLGPQGLPLRFVAQQALPPGQGYEDFVAATGCVPTRDNWHDFFNGLVWLRFGALKARLNALHRQALEHEPPPAPGRRGALRDALTLLDENGAWLAAPTPLHEALRQRHWQRLFGELRPLWAQARLVIVGHALLEQLLEPRKPLCAHVWGEGESPEAPWPPAAERLRAKPFSPLPVLGVPGWWAANEAPDFYADAQVFRPPRPAKTLASAAGG